MKKFLFFFCFVCVNGFGQSLLNERMIGFSWVHPKRALEIPCEIHANLVIIPLVLNHGDTLRFILDSGVSATILTDPDVAKRLALKPIRTIQIAGAGGGTSIAAHVAIEMDIAVGRARATHQQIVYLDQDLLFLSNSIGTKIHGLIGYELFANLVVTLDYVHEKIILRHPDQYTYRKSKGTKFPILIRDNKPFLSSAQLWDRSSQIKPNLMLLDTGAGHIISLDNVHQDTTLFHMSRFEIPLGKGLSGPIMGKYGYVNQLQLGSWLWKRVPASFPTAIGLRKSLKSDDLMLGSLGGDFLHRFTITFHYAEQYVVFKSVGFASKKPFSIGVSGLQWIAKAPNFRDFVVETVLPESPAEEAGILLGDELWSINGLPAKQMSLGEINGILLGKEGKKITLVIRRGGEFQWKQFRLRALFF